MRKSLCFLLILMMVSCSAGKNLPRVNPSQDDLVSTSWVLEEIMGNEALTKDYTKGLPALNFREKGVLDGMTGCNSFSGKYAIGNDLKLKTGAMTKMNCPGSGEADFLEAFNNTTAILMQGKDLLFMNGNDELLRFEPVSKK